MKTKRTSDTTVENMACLAFCTAILAAILWPVAAAVAPSVISIVERIGNALH